MKKILKFFGVLIIANIKKIIILVGILMISSFSYYGAVDENGEKDFESVYAIDIPLFNTQINALLAGKKVDIPHFNFISGKKEYGKTVCTSYGFNVRQRNTC